MIRASRGRWREDKADEILAARRPRRWSCGPRAVSTSTNSPTTSPSRSDRSRLFDAQIAALEDRIEALYETADPAGIVASAPGIGVTLSAGILGRTGDFNRFHSLAGVRSFTGLVPKIDQSGIERPQQRTNQSTATPACARHCSSPRISPARSTPPSPPATTASTSSKANTTTRRSAPSPPCSSPGSRRVGATVSSTNSATPTAGVITEAEGRRDLRRALQNRPRHPRETPQRHHQQTEEGRPGRERSREALRSPTHPTTNIQKPHETLDSR